MSDTFLNSQAVTAEDLNNIAIDLGYADYSHFPETPPQSAVSALNQITADLTGAGILQIGSKCNVTISGNTIVVHDGVCVFENGAKKRIDGTKTLDFIEGGTNYVYLLNNISGNVIQIINSLTPPSTGDYVVLAEIETDKTIHLNRMFSRAKVSALGNSEVVEAQFTTLSEPIQIYCAVDGSTNTNSWEGKRIVDVAQSESSLTEKGYDRISEFLIYATVEDIDITKYSYVICFSPYKRDDSISPKRGNAVYDLKKDCFLCSNSLDKNGGSSYVNTSYADFASYPKSAYFKIIDGKFTMLKMDDYSAGFIRDYTLFFV